MMMLTFNENVTPCIPQEMFSHSLLRILLLLQNLEVKNSISTAVID